METINRSAEIAEQIASIASREEALSQSERYKKEKRCYGCGEKLPEGWPRAHCEDCLKKAREKQAQKRKNWEENGCCVYCGAKLPEGWQYKSCAQCLEKNRARNKAYYRKSKKKTFPQPTETSLSLLGMFSLNPMSNTQEGNMDTNDQHEHEAEQPAVLAESKPQAPEEANQQEATPVSISEQEGYHIQKDDVDKKIEEIRALFNSEVLIQKQIKEADKRLLELSKEKEQVEVIISKLTAEQKQVADSIKAHLR